MSLLPPNPSLVAIILLIRTEHGTKHVYHYPPHPGQDHPPISSRNDGDNGNHSSDSGAGGAAYSTSGESSCSSVENGYGPNSDDDTRGRVNKEKSHVKESGDIDESGSTSPEKGSNTGWVAMKGNKELLGLPSGFSEFLCPPTEMDRRRFEMGIGQLTFLGWPCFAKKDGSWKSKRKQRRTSSKDKTDGKSGSAFGSDKKMKVIDETVEETDSALDSGLVTHDELSEVEPSTTVNEEPTQSPRNDYKQDTAEVKQQDSKNTEPYQPGISIQSGETLTMFHVVFVMNPPPMEYQIRVDEMYSHVVKHFSKALKREQARSNYVLRECQLLKSMKARHGMYLLDEYLRLY